MNCLDQDIRSIKGIGEKKAQAFHSLSVFTLSDLLSCLPSRYEDRSVIKPISLVQDGEIVCICAVVADEPRLSRIRRGLDITRFRAFDDSGQVDISYFNQPYVKNLLHRGESYRFFGKMEVQGRRHCLTNPVFEKEETVYPLSSTGQIVPIYHVRKGITQKNMRQGIRTALDVCRGMLPEPLPDEILISEQLVGAEEAFENIHFPESFTLLEKARKRLVFEELFLLSCALGLKKAEAVREGISLPKPDFERFFAELPFSPTDAQRRAVAEAAADMASGQRMSRLLQGDVGSGKTLVAAALVWQCAEAGYLSAFMVPTEILAEQHYRTLSSLLAPYGCRIALLTGSMHAAEKRAVYAKLAEGELDLIIGTHALLNGEIRYPRLALTITDEQHRFGVEQRARLNSAGEREPHVYVMSATPIPRTLALIIYGDLSVSVLDELPAGRQKVDTFCVGSAYHERLTAFIRNLCEEGRQVFVVCPRVEEDEDLEALPGAFSGPALRNAVDYAKQLQTELPELRIACMHGRLNTAEKDRIMNSFICGGIDLLVSTTVIEVGVDVPNAVLMLVENAERFGISQLHQLRGRVGRGKYKSYCVLVSDSDSDDAKRRLKVLCDTDDGFKIAEEDLRLRGPGDFFGSRQHGLPEMHVADLGTDTGMLLRSKKAADRLLETDPTLSHPEHKALYERVNSLLLKTQGSFN